ncbi:MAG: DUF434 domain-containing protein [Planctomycetota bacterium]|jgi:hypothetical protein
MPDKRSHRGPHPEDARLFNARTLPTLQKAVADMGWLLSRGYADKSSLKIVGDRYALTQRQRLAVMRASCSDSQRENRSRKQISPEQVQSQPLKIDGYNLLITVEAALARAPLFICRDGSIRDLASIHGTYRKVEETLPAIEIIAHVLNKLNFTEVIWLLDKPVSNSGRLKKRITSFCETNSLNWDVQLVPNPDTVLIQSSDIIASSDSSILDGCKHWLNLARIIIDHISTEYDLNLLDLSESRQQ